MKDGQQQVKVEVDRTEEPGRRRPWVEPRLERRETLPRVTHQPMAGSWYPG